MIVFDLRTIKPKSELTKEERLKQMDEWAKRERERYLKQAQRAIEPTIVRLQKQIDDMVNSLPKMAQDMINTGFESYARSYTDVLINRARSEVFDLYRSIYDFEAFLETYRTTVRVDTDKHLSIEQKSQAIVYTAQKLHQMIEQRFAHSSNIDFFHDIAVSLQMLAHHHYSEGDRYKKPRYDRLKQFLHYLENNDMNWIREDDGGYYYIDLIEAIGLFLEGIEIFERHKQKYIELSETSGKTFALDPQAETNIHIMRNVHPFMRGNEPKKVFYVALIYLISKKLEVDLDALKRIMAYLITNQDKASRHKIVSIQLYPHHKSAISQIISLPSF